MPWVKAMKPVFLALVILALVSGCAAPGTTPVRVVDGSSESSTVESMRLMTNNLPGEDHCQLQIAFARIRLGDPAFSSYSNLGKKLNGMTAQQVIDFSQQYPPLPLAEMGCIP